MKIPTSKQACVGFVEAGWYKIIRLESMDKATGETYDHSKKGK